MPRVDRSRPSVRLRPSLSLERLRRAPIAEHRSHSCCYAAAAASDDGALNPGITTQTTPPLFRRRSLFSADTKGLWPQSDHRPGSRRDDRPCDAYNQPNIKNDISVFSSEFQLPQMDGKNGDPTLSVLVPTGQPTPINRLRAGLTPAGARRSPWTWSGALHRPLRQHRLDHDHQQRRRLLVRRRGRRAALFKRRCLCGTFRVGWSFRIATADRSSMARRHDGQFTTYPNAAYIFSTGYNAAGIVSRLFTQCRGCRRHEPDASGTQRPVRLGKRLEWQRWRRQPVRIGPVVSILEWRE